MGVGELLMEILNNLFSGGKPKEEVNNVKDEYLQEAQEAVAIVNNGVEKGSFSEMTEKLDKLPSVNSSRDKYVFENNRSVVHFWIIIVCAVFAACYLCYMPIYIGTMVYSDTFRMVALIGVVISAIVFVINILIMVKEFCQIRFSKRYNTYVKDLRFKNIELIDDLAVYSKAEPEKVIKDLNKAVKMKLIPQGHFGRDNLIFIVSDELYEKYKDKQAVYDRYYRKQVEERLRMKERTKEMQAIMNQGQGYIDKIHESNDIIKDKIISQKLDRMESVVSMIFHEVDVNPQNADKLGMFMNYYLPTTEKLLEAYIEIDEKQIKGKSLEKTKKDIEGAIDKIIDSFEGLLDKFYQEKELDIATDISAMEILMKQDGLSE